MRSVNVPPTSTPTRQPMSAPALRAKGGCCLLVDGEGEVLEGAGEDDAVVALGAFDAHVLVEDVVEHGVRLTAERVAPSAAAAVVVHDPLRLADGHPLGRVLNDEGILGAVADHH